MFEPAPSPWFCAFEMYVIFQAAQLSCGVGISGANSSDCDGTSDTREILPRQVPPTTRCPEAQPEPVKRRSRLWCDAVFARKIAPLPVATVAVSAPSSGVGHLQPLDRCWRLFVFIGVNFQCACLGIFDVVSISTVSRSVSKRSPIIPVPNAASRRLDIAAAPW